MNPGAAQSLGGSGADLLALDDDLSAVAYCGLTQIFCADWNHFIVDFLSTCFFLLASVIALYFFSC